jgi:hypothetical protein
MRQRKLPPIPEEGQEEERGTGRETRTETSFGTIQNKTFDLVVSLLYRNERFNVSIEPKQTEDQPKQFGREHILVIWQKVKGFPFFSVCFGLFENILLRFFHFYTETESFDVLIEPKQAEDQPKQLNRKHILVFF